MISGTSEQDGVGGGGGTRCPDIWSSLDSGDGEETERQRQIVLTLQAALRSVQERAGNVVFTFAPDVRTCVAAMEFATLLRRCYPFLTFTIDLLPQNAGLLLSVHAPAAKERTGCTDEALHQIRHAFLVGATS